MNAAVVPPVELRGLPSHLRVLHALGEGGTAVVYEGFHERLRVPVAIKVLRAFGNLREEASERLKREAALCAQLNNSHVPRIYDVDTLPGGTPYLVMELIRGRGVDTVIGGTGLCYEDAAWLLSELLDALQALHDTGIVHRDIKPENLLLQQNANGGPLLRLIDFGVAKVLEPGASISRLTQDGTLVGTPQYIAPEVLLGQSADRRADLYAAAVTFFELLAGALPFDDSSLGAAMAASLRDDPRSLCALRPDLSPDVERFVLRGMARDPSRRFGSAEEMRQALGELRWQVPGASSLGASLSGLGQLPAPSSSEIRVRDPGISPRTGAGRASLRFVTALLAIVSIGYAFDSLSRTRSPAAPAPAASVPVSTAGPGDWMTPSDVVPTNHAVHPQQSSPALETAQEQPSLLSSPADVRLRTSPRPSASTSTPRRPRRVVRPEPVVKPLAQQPKKPDSPEAMPSADAASQEPPPAHVTSQLKAQRALLGERLQKTPTQSVEVPALEETPPIHQDGLLR